MKFTEKLERSHCYIVAVFLKTGCHISLTTRGGEYIPSLKKVFARRGAEVEECFIFDVDYLNHWDRVHEKYAWRYMMWKAGYDIINQDASIFVDVYQATWETARAHGDHIRWQLTNRPIRQILATKKKRRSVKFLPLQVLRKAVDATELEQRRYSDFEQRLTHKEYLFSHDIPITPRMKIRKRRPIGRRKPKLAYEFIF